MSGLVAPFPYFGGKRGAAADVWARFGTVRNYVEPFFGSGAVLLNRPLPFDGSETVNDLDCFLANFWRALAADPDAVAAAANWPVNEADLHARHRWLVENADFREQMKRVPDYFDAKVAGYWVWGLCQWIGTGWCSTATAPSPRQRGDGHPPQQLPHLGNAGMGIHRKLPHLGDAGRGIHRKLPHLGAGRGIHRKLPHLGDAGRGEALLGYLSDLSTRLRGVRVACGDWKRVLGPSVTWRHGLTAIFLDPPYTDGNMTYAVGEQSVAAEVAAWAIANGDNKQLRIAVCGHEGEHSFPSTWEAFAWKARGGYGNQDDDDANDNRHRERIWFSPHCLGGRQAGLPGLAI